MGISSQYVVFFEVSQKGYQWWAPALGLFFVLSGWMIAKTFRRSSWPLFRFWSFSGSIMFWFACIWTLVLFGATFPGYLGAQYAFRTGHYAVIEGHVTNFAPMTRVLPMECFTVSSQRFCYSDSEMKPGFNQTASHGGPIHDGLPVRISYSEDTILRLEINADN
jgi:hypothetical protein